MLVVDSHTMLISALKLRLALDDYFPGRSVVLLFGVSEDKDLCGMFNMLLPVCAGDCNSGNSPARTGGGENCRYGASIWLPAKLYCSGKSLQCALEAAGDDAVWSLRVLFIAAAVRTAWQAIQLKCLA